MFRESLKCCQYAQNPIVYIAFDWPSASKFDYVYFIDNHIQRHFDILFDAFSTTNHLSIALG